MTRDSVAAVQRLQQEFVFMGMLVDYKELSTFYLI